LAFLLTLSSTAAATKMLVDHGELGAPHGRTVLGIAVAQDLAVVPMIVVIPLLAASGVAAPGEPVADALLNLAALAGVVAVAKLAVKRVVRVVCATRNRELFVLFLATWCLGFAAITAYLGMSLALGAFLAGVLLADSDYHSQAASEVEPFRDAFASLFFVSIGMLFDWGTIAAAPWTVFGVVVAVVVGKAAIVAAAAWALGQPFWVRIRAGLTLAQVGEFSFVLVQLGKDNGLLEGPAEALFVVAAVASIAATPLLYALGGHLAARARRAAGGPGPASVADERAEHAVIVGYGPTGRVVASGLEAAGIPFVVAEMNAATVRAEKARGVPIVLADATRMSVLNSLGVARAQLVVLAVNDAAATRRIAQLVRQSAPNAHILARAAYETEVAPLQQSGAHEVVPQELEASVEMLVRVLRRFLVTDDEVGRQVRSVRARAGVGGRASPVPSGEVDDVAGFVPGLGFAVQRVQEGSLVAGRQLKDAGVRRSTGCSVVAIRRGDESIAAIHPDTALEVGDVVVVIGPRLRLPDAAEMFAAAAGAPRSEQT
jgi:CPA2 family monovalent cation:H+ antiporter-2